MIAYAVAYKIAYTEGYIKLHMILGELLRKWEATTQQQQQQQNLFLEGCASLTQP